MRVNIIGGMMSKIKGFIERFLCSCLSNISVTFIVVAFVAIVMFFIVMSVGIIDDKESQASSIASTACFLLGYPDGVDSINKVDNKYMFNCSEKNITIKYDVEAGVGEVFWPKE